jgi:hypothetical protein
MGWCFYHSTDPLYQQVLHVVAALLAPSPALRPSAAAVRCHPMWWPPHTQLTFLQEVSDFMVRRHIRSAFDGGFPNPGRG